LFAGSSFLSGTREEPYSTSVSILPSNNKQTCYAEHWFFKHTSACYTCRL